MTTTSTVATTVSPAPLPPIIQLGGPYATALAAIFAAAIAATVALRSIEANRKNLITQLAVQRDLAVKTSRASVVSANRQRWIDALRDDLADLIAEDSVLVDDGPDRLLRDAEQEKRDEQVQLAIKRRRLLRSRIQLRLNPTKPHHEALLAAVDDLMDALKPEHREATRFLIENAQAFLRREWLRVKSEAGSFEPT